MRSGYVASSENATVEKTYDEAKKKLTVYGGVETRYFISTVYTITFEGKSKDAVYQIPNADFENWTDDESAKLAEGWNSFDTAAGLFASFTSMSPMPPAVDGYSGNGVRLVFQRTLWIAYANGNLTTGHINMGNTNPADASNYNFTDRTDVNGNMPFAGRPDAFEVYARFTPGTAKALTDAEKEEGKEGNLRCRITSSLSSHKDPAYQVNLELARDERRKASSLCYCADSSYCGVDEVHR